MLKIIVISPGIGTRRWEEGEDLSGIPYDEEGPPQLSIQFEGRLSLQLYQDTPARSLQAHLVAWLGQSLFYYCLN